MLHLSPAAELVPFQLSLKTSNVVLVRHAVQGYRQGGYAHEDPHRPSHRHSREADSEVSIKASDLLDLKTRHPVSLVTFASLRLGANWLDHSVPLAQQCQVGVHAANQR
jgi:hypothetical protein